MLSIARQSLVRPFVERRKMSSNSFVDYFGTQVGAANYAAFRPIYPASFIATIISKCPRTSLIAFLAPICTTYNLL